MKEDQNIKVVARLRPLNQLEMNQGGECCVNFSDKSITVTLGQQEKVDFTFDRIFGPNSLQLDVFDEVARPILDSVLSGYNGTIFAYGQTSSGKTYSMEGPDNADENTKGLIPRVMSALFESIESLADEDVIYNIKVSFLEIYNEKINDLLDINKTNMQIKEDRMRGVFVHNLTEIVVRSPSEMLKVMQTGSSNRTIAATRMNERSSRSHSLFQIQITQKNTKMDSNKFSKLYFVDLAGSEKTGKTLVSGQQLEEAKSINKSLTQLGMVINALTSDKKEHVPYRDSKLTRILSESLGGNAKTTLIVACSMCSYNDRETLTTLRFGQRAKAIKNKPIINAEKSSRELQILLDIAEKKISSQEDMIKELMNDVDNKCITQVIGGNNKQASSELMRKNRIIIDFQEQVGILQTELSKTQIEYQKAAEDWKDKLNKNRQNEEQLKLQIQENYKTNQKLILENEQIRHQLLDNELKVTELKRSIQIAKQDISFFIRNFQIKNQIISDTESTKDIFMVEQQYDRDIEERTYQSILKFQEAISDIDRLFINNDTFDASSHQTLDIKKKNKSFQLESESTSPKLSKLMDSDDEEQQMYGLTMEESEQSLKVEEESDVEKLLAMLCDKTCDDTQTIYNIQEILHKMRYQIERSNEKYNEAICKYLRIQDQHNLYVLKQKQREQQFKQFYQQKKQAMQSNNQSLIKQLEDLTIEYMKFRSEQEKQFTLLYQTNQSLMMALESHKRLNESTLPNTSPLSREFQLECTIKQLMQERNELSMTLTSTRQDIDALHKSKQAQLQYIAELKDTISNLQLKLQEQSLQGHIFRRRPLEGQIQQQQQQYEIERRSINIDTKDGDVGQVTGRIPSTIVDDKIKQSETKGQTITIDELKTMFKSGQEQQGGEQEYIDITAINGSGTIIPEESPAGPRQDVQDILSKSEHAGAQTSQTQPGKVTIRRFLSQIFG